MSQKSLQKNPVKAVKGTRDLLPTEYSRFVFLRNHFEKITSLYGFGLIETPILESLQVFTHSLGESSDVVTKQMYCFKDNNDEALVLRPEGTAGVARAFVNEGLSQEVPVKLSYYGPMFRYERPQKGRYRQFFQMGAELIGAAQAQADIECIACAAQLLKAIGLENRVQLQINSIGDIESRNNYRQALTDYLKNNFDQLSQDSQNRLEKNPLRILDSKDEKDKALLVNAPKFSNYLNESSKKFFDDVLEGLQKLNINFKVDDYLVRGFDYYCHTVFEFTTNELGSQNAVLSGGRYDGLIEDLGGPKTPGVGWAAGVDRLSLMIEEPKLSQRPISIIPTEDTQQSLALQLCQEIRQNGLRADLSYSGNIQKRLKRANKIQSKFAIILGSRELEQNKYVLKNLDEGSQIEIPSQTWLDEILRNC